MTSRPSRVHDEHPGQDPLVTGLVYLILAVILVAVSSCSNQEGLSLRTGAGPTSLSPTVGLPEESRVELANRANGECINAVFYPSRFNSREIKVVDCEDVTARTRVVDLQMPEAKAESTCRKDNRYTIALQNAPAGGSVACLETLIRPGLCVPVVMYEDGRAVPDLAYLDQCGSSLIMPRLARVSKILGDYSLGQGLLVPPVLFGADRIDCPKASQVRRISLPGEQSAVACIFV